VNIQSVFLRIEGKHGDAYAAGQRNRLNNALFHFSSHVNQTQRRIIHILHFWLLDVLLNYAHRSCS